MWTDCDCGGDEGAEDESGDGEYDEYDEDYDEPYECCEIEGISSRARWDVEPASQPGLVRIVRSAPHGEGGDGERSEPREVPLRRLSCQGDGPAGEL
jgi:hypothetical protein